VHTPANYLAFEEKGPGNKEGGQDRGARARGGKGGKGVRDRKGDGRVWKGRRGSGARSRRFVPDLEKQKVATLIYVAQS